MLGRLSGATQDRFGWYPGDWFWRVLLGLVVAIAGATAAIVLADAGAKSSTIVATQGGPVHTPTTTAETATVTLPGTSTAPGPPTTPTQPPPQVTTAPPPGALTAWPAGRNGFTVVLESLPSSSGRSLALARARAASRAGLPQVGILDSSRYSSLHPGYYVVFSGIYGSRSQADAARATAASKGFRLAYSREIAR